MDTDSGRHVPERRYEIKKISKITESDVYKVFLYENEKLKTSLVTGDYSLADEVGQLFINEIPK